MELDQGFKQTEAGLIPVDWVDTTIGGLISEKIIEKPMDGNHGNIHPKSSDFVDFGIPFVMANNVQNGRVDLDNCSYITKKQADSLLKGFSIAGDVLLTHKATIGNTAIVPTINTEYVMLTPQVTYYRIKDKSRLDNHYLRHAFDGNQFQKTLKQLSGGGTRGYIGISAQHSLPIALPKSKIEQECIANTLSDADAYIESLEKLIAKVRLIKNGVIQELLTGKRRLKGFSSDWSNFILSDCLVAPLDYGINAAGSPVLPGLPTYLRITDIDDEGYLIPEGMISVDHPQSQNYQLEENQIVFARTGASVGKTYLYNKDDGRLVFAGFLIRGKINCKVLNSKFFLFVTQSKHYKNWVKVMSMRSGQPGINGNEYASFQFNAPTDIKEQEAIAEVIDDLSSDIARSNEKLKKARLLKQGMMQELLTGRIRLV